MRRKASHLGARRRLAPNTISRTFTTLAVLVAALATVLATGTDVATARTITPYHSTSAGDLYRVGAVKPHVRARLIGYKHRPVVVAGLRHHLRHGVLGVSRSGRIVAPRRVAAASARQRRHYRTRLVVTARAAATPGSGCTPAYSANSPWNTPIGGAPTVDSGNAQFVASMDPSTAKLTSDPTQYTLPVYYATNATPLATVSYADGWFSDVSNGGNTLTNNRPATAAARVTKMPIPLGLSAASGSDAQIIIINTDTGEEWGASHFTRDAAGNYSAWNIGHYNIAWSGVPPYGANGNPFWQRGPGTPYLTGLIRPCEIAQGHIDHALAFAFPKTTPEFVYPATRSDGQSPATSGMPEGARLQLDPSVSDDTIRNVWHCTDACFTVAKAAQTYGMYVADTAGRPKVYFEYEATAHWNGAVTASTVSPIPLSAFRVVRPPAH